ncbi:MAG: triose-phosphate isomerase [Thermoplasmata archaeon]|nr:triose-phosphate isomerase [Thermoplasmata archaeon]
MHVMVVNVKAYSQGIADEAVKIAKIMEDAGREFGVRMIIAVQPSDIYRVSNSSKIDVFAQHIDAISPGGHTGWVLADAVKAAGARGSILNHSEHRLKIDDIYESLRILKEKNMESIVCASSHEIAKAVASMEPDYVAVEPPELIGGDISVTKAKPEIISRSVEEVQKVSNSKVLCGAGIKNGEDVAKAIELGADGILVASGVVKALDKESIIKEMAEAMSR